MVLELNDFLQSGYYESLLGYDLLYWFVNVVRSSEKNSISSSKNNENDFRMTDEDEVGFKNNNNRHFCEENKKSSKVRDHSHLMGNYRGTANQKCNINVTLKQKYFNSIYLRQFQ